MGLDDTPFGQEKSVGQPVHNHRSTSAANRFHGSFRRKSCTNRHFEGAVVIRTFARRMAKYPD
ncbi:MAG: hypothetical protein LBH80_06495 [Prevotellaceae bacterium]|nr:hypothetical protein [Prevotellaceae bacterium]